MRHSRLAFVEAKKRFRILEIELLNTLVNPRSPDLAHILFAWELGGGFGHVAPHLPVIDGLLARGHQVSFALRNVANTARFFEQRNVRCLQAPFRLEPAASPVRTPLTFPHILHNCGYDDADKLRGLVLAWRSLYELVQPDIVIFDHAPTAILASRGHSFRRASLGTGFYVPPDSYPLPNLRPSVRVPAERLRADEDRVLATINNVLERLQLEPLSQIGKLFDLDAQFFRTVRELDHYRDRGDAEYLGSLPTPVCEIPVWPEGEGMRIFVYLKTSGLREVLRVLKSMSFPTLIFVSGLSPDVGREFSAPHMRFANKPLDIAAVAKQADVAVLNGSHDTAMPMLLAGVPTVNIPLYLEQSLLAARVAELGAGIHVSAARGDLVRRALNAASTSDEFRRAAADFAARYGAHDPGAQLERLLDRIDDLAGNGVGRVVPSQDSRK